MFLTNIFYLFRMLSMSSSRRTKSSLKKHVILVAIYSSLLLVLCYADTDSTNTWSTSRQILSYSSRPDSMHKLSVSDDSTDSSFIPLINSKHPPNAKTSDESFEHLKNSKLFQKYTENAKIHLLSSASASALLSSSTLSVDELPKPQVQKQTPTVGATAVSKKNNETHHHKHRNKHHSKKRHHKVCKFLKYIK